MELGKLPSDVFHLESDHDAEKSLSAISQDRLPTVQKTNNQDLTTATNAEAVSPQYHCWSLTVKWMIYIGLALMYIIFELDNTTISLYMPYATSSFKQHSDTALITVIWSIVYAAAKPPIAKLSDIIGRAQTYCICVASFCLSYIILSTANNIQTYACGYVFYGIGQTGVQVLDVLIISDITTARWRGLWLGVSYSPFLITCFVSANIAQAFIQRSSWRWGIGIFGFLMPSCSTVLLGGLFLAQRQKNQKKTQLGNPNITVYNNAFNGFKKFLSDLDIGGIILLSGGTALVLVPCSIAGSTPSKWKIPAFYMPLAIGSVFLLIFPLYERYVARFPLVPFSFFKNRAIVVSCILCFFDSCSWSVVVTYLFSWILVTQGWSLRDAGYYSYAHGLSYLLASMAAGAVMWKTRRYKYLLFFSLSFRMIGFGLMLRFRHAPEHISVLVLAQVVSGFGSGVILQICQVASQIAVKRSHLASVTAFVLLCSSIGNATGSSIAGGMWTTGLPKLLAQNLPDLSSEQIAEIFNSITELPAYGTPARAGIAAAYIAIMRRLVICALCLCAPSFVTALFLPDSRLGDTHNEVDDIMVGDKDERSVNEGNVDQK